MFIVIAGDIMISVRTELVEGSKCGNLSLYQYKAKDISVRTVEIASSRRVGVRKDSFVRRRYGSTGSPRTALGWLPTNGFGMTHYERI